MSTATRARRKDSGSRAIAGNTCPAITASSGRAPVRRSAASRLLERRDRAGTARGGPRCSSRRCCAALASDTQAHPRRVATAAAQDPGDRAPGRGPPRSRASHTAPTRSATARPRCAPRVSGSSRCIPGREGPVRGPGPADGQRPSGSCAAALVPIAAAGGRWLCGYPVAHAARCDGRRNERYHRSAGEEGERLPSCQCRSSVRERRQSQR